MNTDTNNPTIRSIDAIAPATPASPTTTPIPSQPAVTSKQAAAKVALTFITKDNDTSLLTSTSRILGAMAGNVNYPNPAPTLASVTAARDALLAVINDANDSKLTLATRRSLRPPLAALLRQLALYVQTASNGDPVVLMGSGFPLQRLRQPAGVLPAPGNLRLARGKVSGQLRAYCNVITLAAAYQWRIAAVPAPTTWLPADPTCSAHATLTGLTPGTQYLVQVRAIGSQGPGDWSDAAVQISM